MASDKTKISELDNASNFDIKDTEVTSVTNIWSNFDGGTQTRLIESDEVTKICTAKRN